MKCESEKIALTVCHKNNGHPNYKNSNECPTGRADQIKPNCWELLITNISFNKYPAQKTKNEYVDIKRSI